MTSFKPHVRPMRAGDAEAIHAIFATCLRIDLAPRLASRALEAWLAGQSPQGYRPSLAPGEHYLVAEHPGPSAGEVVGYASHSGRELTGLFVAPQCQRRGLGTALFLACDSEADLAFVSAAPRSVGFYERFGFSRAGPMAIRRGAPMPHVAMQRG